MFNGIVQQTGVISSCQMSGGCHHLVITPEMPMPDLDIGESISVNGVCLSVTSFTQDSFQISVVPETLRRTNLGGLAAGGKVNLERSMRMGDRMSGHYVQGHIDGTGRILELHHDQGDAWLLKISIPRELGKYTVAKGYIALDGMSITLIDAAPEWFTITLIPHTQAVTVARHYKVGAEINIEVDMMGKYIHRYLEAYRHDLHG